MLKLSEETEVMFKQQTQGLWEEARVYSEKSIADARTREDLYHQLVQISRSMLPQDVRVGLIDKIMARQEHDIKLKIL